uniref:Uncharacterized protein n=1 Tax=viral metagenome TaxID=1070528 RepID=A0A6H1Z9T7_9ZZZZ
MKELHGSLELKFHEVPDSIFKLIVLIAPRGEQECNGTRWCTVKTVEGVEITFFRKSESGQSE